MFCLLIYLCFHEQNVKKSFMIKFYIPQLENQYTFQIAKYYIKIF